MNAFESASADGEAIVAALAELLLVALEAEDREAGVSTEELAQ